MREYSELLEEEVFKDGEERGSVRTALTILTDMLIELNSLEIFYQKPSNKSITPKEIATIRAKIDEVKKLLQVSLTATNLQ